FVPVRMEDYHAPVAKVVPCIESATPQTPAPPVQLPPVVPAQVQSPEPAPVGVDALPRNSHTAVVSSESPALVVIQQVVPGPNTSPAIQSTYAEPPQTPSGPAVQTIHDLACGPSAAVSPTPAVAVPVIERTSNVGVPTEFDADAPATASFNPGW